jgi:hypothetical protein
VNTSKTDTEFRLNLTYFESFSSKFQHAKAFF